MKKLYFIFVLCVTIALCSQDPARVLQTLRLMASDCSSHGYLFKGQCFCQAQWTGKLCEKSTSHGTYDNPNDKCDDLIFRLDNLLNISPDNYLFDDDEFPRMKGDSIGEGDAAYGDKGSSWIKMHDLVKDPKDFKIFGKLDYTDVKQGALGNCYLLAAFASLVRVRGGEVIKDAFVTKEDNNKHVYITRWLIDGKPRFVAVDEWIPGEGHSASFSKITEDNELWSIILEKAWAKIHGTYMRTQGGWHTNVWKSLSQAPVYDAYHSYEKFDKNSVFTYVQNLLNKEFAIGAATVAIASTHEVGGHAYSILDAKEVRLDNGQTEKLFRMYNPWNSEVWQENPWGDDSQNWTENVKSQVNYVKGNDGQFWTSTSDYLSNFGMMNWAEIQRDYDVAFQDIPLTSRNDETVKYETKVQITGNNKKVLYISVDEVDSRLQRGCGSPWNIQNLNVAGPNGQVYTPKGPSDGYTVKIENAADGVYTVTAEVTKRKDYALYFTVTTYSARGVASFLARPNSDVVIPNKKQCPNNCNGKGRCNLYSGECTCYFPYEGQACTTFVESQCPNNCNGNGVCDKTYGKCQCKQGYIGQDCLPCKDKTDGCSYYVGLGYCEPSNQWYESIIRDCPKSCIDAGFTKGLEECVMENGPTPQPKPKKCEGNTCSGNGQCNESNGVCQCNQGYYGNRCENREEQPEPEPEPQPKPEPTPKPDCQDKIDCKVYVENDYCQTYKDNMNYYCPKSCRFC